jgi:thiamine transporter
MDNTGAGRLCKPRLSLTKALFELPIYLRQFFILKGVFSMRRKRNENLRALSESALMIALATVLGFIKLIDLPYGGAVTIASMLPIAIISYRHGVKRGLFAATVYGGIQQLLGLSMLSWATSWKAVVAIVLLDYIVAFAVIGFAGAFRKSVGNQALSVSLGCLVVSLLRYICHVISGATVWAGLSIPTEAALAFSFAYNATYMIPETIILLVCAVYIASNIDFRPQTPTRMRTQGFTEKQAWISPTAGLVGAVAMIADTVLIFRNVQNEDGSFSIESFRTVNWTLVIAITAIAALIIASLLTLRSMNPKNTKK